MASLQDRVRQGQNLVRGQSGILTEETPEGIQQLAGKAGLQAPPITPVGQAAIGANPDQQKMAGTPNQKQAAMALASQPNQTLQDTLRTQQSRTQQTGQEQQQTQKSQDMQNLGQLGDRVNDFINVQRQKLQAQAGQGVAVEAASGQVNGVDLAGLKPLLQQYRENPTDQNTLLQLNKALGYNVNTQLSPQQVDQLYQSSVDAIAKGGAGDVDNDLTVDDLTKIQGFSYTPDQLSQLLGVPADQISKMSVGQLRQQIDTVGQQEFSKTQQLQQQASSGILGQAERALAQSGAREASSTGVRATEADYQNLENKIQNADQVTFNGQKMSVDDILKDDNISGIISDYLNSAEGSDTRKQLDQNEPELSQFINENKAVLDDASKQMQAGAQTFQQTQAYNQSLLTQPFGGTKLDSNVMQAILPGINELQANRIDPNSVPALKYVSQAGPQVGMQFANLVNAEQSKDPQFASELAGLNDSQLQQWGIGQQGSAFETKYLPAKRQYEAIQSASNPDQLVTAAISGVTGIQDAQQKISQNRASKVLGFGGSQIPSVLDSDGNGVIDSPDQLKQSLLQANPRPSLSQSPDQVQGYQKQSISPPPVPGDPIAQGVLSKLQDAASKGFVNSDDLKKANLSQDEAIYLLDKFWNKPGSVSADPNGIQDVVVQKRAEATQQLLGPIQDDYNSIMKGIYKSQGQDGAPFTYVDPVIMSKGPEIVAKLKDAISKQGPNRVETNRLEAMVRDIEGQMTNGSVSQNGGGNSRDVWSQVGDDLKSGLGKITGGNSIF